MSRKVNPACIAAPLQRQPPVRVRSRRITADSAKLYPPDGEERIWWGRLKQALGTSSSDFVTASLHQLQAAAQFPGSGISETTLRSLLSRVLRPGMRSRQRLLFRWPARTVPRCRSSGDWGLQRGTEDHVCRFAAAAARLLRAYATQFEAYRRLRHGGDQYVRVEHVHINDGAQAVIGNVCASEPWACADARNANASRPGQSQFVACGKRMFGRTVDHLIAAHDERRWHNRRP
jgi:hypothetical protein